jgi:hypothetical protein
VTTRRVGKRRRLLLVSHASKMIHGRPSRAWDIV